MTRNSGFKDPIAKPEGKSVKEPYGQKNMYYDQRSSIYVDAGSTYGVGHRNPVGHEGEPKQRVDTLPFGRVNTMDVSNPKTRLPINLEE